MPDIKEIQQEIRDIESQGTIEVSEIGNIDHDGYAQPILAIETPGKAGQNILITAGIHGDEPAGVLAAIEFLKRLASEPVNHGFTIIPYINPWGYDNRRRFNPARRDINRDFLDPSTQEARIMIQYLSGRKFDLVLDLHEDTGHSNGYYLYNLSKNAILFTRAKTMIHRMRELGFPIERRMRIFPFRTQDGIIAIPCWASHVPKMVNRLAFCHYCRIKGVSENIVVTETPTFLPLEKRVQLQSLSIEALTGPLSYPCEGYEWSPQ